MTLKVTTAMMTRTTILLNSAAVPSISSRWISPRSHYESCFKRLRYLKIINAPSPAMMPPAIDSTGKPLIFGRDAVVVVEVFAELVVFET